MVLAEPTFAATSPWTQTDWSGGSGQTSWSDATKFDSSSSITTSTTGQATLTPNAEKLSNTGIETDLTNWSQTAETVTGTFSDTTFANTSGAVVAWPLDDTTSTQSYARAVNPAVATGRNVVVNGTFDSDTLWTHTSNWSISGGVAHNDGTNGSSNSMNMNPTASLVTGKVYQATFTVSNFSAGTGFKLLAGGSSTATNHAANGTFTEYIIAVGTSNVFIQAGANTVGDIDNISVVEVNIPSSNATATQLLTDGDMETSGTSSWSSNNSATLTKQSTSPHGGSQVIRIARNGVNNPFAVQSSILTIGQVYRMTGYARSDGSATPVIGSFTPGATALFTGTTSTSWQPFDVLFIATNTGVYMLATTSTGSQYVEFDDVVVSSDNYIRSGELLPDGNMETSGTGYWVAQNSAALTKETASPHGGTQNIKVARNGVSTPYTTQANVLVIGKTYRLTGYARSDGNVTPIVGTVTPGVAALFTGTTSTSWQPIDVTFVAANSGIYLMTSTSTGTQYTEYDDLSVTEIDPLSGIPANGVTLGSTASGHLTNAYTFDGTNDNVNIYSADVNSAFNQSEGTALVWAKASGSGVWTDGADREILRLLADGSNFILLRKTIANNNITAFYSAGGTQKSILSTFSGTGWFQFVLTWSKSADQVKVYVNGSQSGSTLTGLGTWAGNLASGQNFIGAADTAGTRPWSGMINDVRLYNRALTATEISNLYNGFSAARDTGQAHGGTASMKVVTDTYSNADIIQSLNVGDTNTYNLVAYAYTTGAAVTSADAELFYNGSTISTTYTSVGSGWYKLSGTLTGANASRNYGVQVKANKTVYLDDFSLNNYASSGTLTSSIFDTGQGSNWGTLTYNATIPTGTSVTVKARSSNSSSMSGATAFSSCSAITSGTDISSNTCMTDTHRYVQYQLTLTATDTSLTPTFQDLSLAFTVSDATAPALTLTAVSPDPTTDTRPTLNGTAVDAAGTISSVEFQMDSTAGVWTACTASDGNFNSASESFSCRPTALADGAHTMYVRTTDNAANISAPSSDSFTVDTTPPLSFSSDSPGNNSYTTNERESFRWHPTTDVTSGITKYVLEIDNPSFSDSQPSGDFSIDGIPAASSADIVTSKYVIHYESNLISVRTLSSTEWESSQNDGKLREGVVHWRVKAVDGAGNETNVAQNLFVDQTSPETSLTQLNDQSVSQSAYLTTNQSPTLFGTITDLLRGGNQAETQQENGPRVASGPQQVEITITKTDEGAPKIISLTTQQLTSPSWTCGGAIQDNSLQKCDKTSGFSFTPSVPLAFGKYTIQVVGKDGVGNSSEKTLQLTIAETATTTSPKVAASATPLSSPQTPLPSATPLHTGDALSPAPTITQAVEPTGPSILEKIGTASNQLLDAIANVLAEVGSGTQWLGGTAITQSSQLFAWLTDVASQGFLTSVTALTNSVNFAADLTQRSVEVAGVVLAQMLSSGGNSLITFSQASSGSAQATLRMVGKSLSDFGGTLNKNSQFTANWIGKTGRAGTSFVAETMTHTTLSAKLQLITFGTVVSRNVENASNTFSEIIVAFGYRFSSQPTRIFNVQVTALSPTSAKITWETNHLANGKVNYGLTDAYAQDIQSDEQTKFHEFVLKDLTPNTEYHFEVMSHGKNYVYDANRRFTTPAK